MPSFEYVTRDSRGIIVKGLLEAEDDKRALMRLKQQGLFITSLRRRAPATRSLGWNRTQVAAFTQDLEILVSAGMPLFQALQTLAEELEDARMRVVVTETIRQIEEGKPLSVALSRYPDLFSSMYVGVVRNGEMTGRLDQALQRLTAHLERELEFRRKIREAFFYPVIVLALAGLVLAVFLTYIIPAFDRVYRSTGADLPVLTRAIIAGSRTFRQTLPVTGIAVAIMLIPAVRARLWSRTAGVLQRQFLRMPRVGTLVQTMLLARFTQSMGMMLRSGVPLTSALEMAEEAVSADEYRPVIEGLRTDISRGRKLSDAMRGTKWFSPMIIRMVGLGEESGRLDVMMERAAAVLDRDFDLRVRRLLSLLEPAVTLGLGGVIGFILLALYLPIFGLSKTIVR